jgi:hypothetical protein
LPSQVPGQGRKEYYCSANAAVKRAVFRVVLEQAREQGQNLWGLRVGGATRGIFCLFGGGPS